MAEDLFTSSIDLKRLRDEAMAAGFNPLTVLRSGIGAGWATQRTQYGVTGGGGFTSDPAVSTPVAAVPKSVGFGGGFAASGEFFEPAAGHALDPSLNMNAVEFARYGYSGGDNHGSYGPWEAESEWDMAVHQLRMRNAGTGSVVTDDGVVVSTRAPKAAAVQGGMFNPIAYTAAPAVAGVPALGPVRPGGGMSVGNPAVMEQFQSEQVWQTDKLPKVVMGDIYHPLFPGVTWLETGGSTRGETFQTIYGDEGAGSLMSWPKWAYDAGKNVERFGAQFVPKHDPDASWWPSIKWSPD